MPYLYTGAIGTPFPDRAISPHPYHRKPPRPRFMRVDDRLPASAPGWNSSSRVRHEASAKRYASRRLPARWVSAVSYILFLVFNSLKWPTHTISYFGYRSWFVCSHIPGVFFLTIISHLAYLVLLVMLVTVTVWFDICNVPLAKRYRTFTKVPSYRSPFLGGCWVIFIIGRG